MNLPTQFSPKEVEVIDCLVRGKTMNEIAEIVHRSPRTIETRINNLKNKIGCDRKSDLIGWLIDNLYTLKCMNDETL